MTKRTNRSREEKGAHRTGRRDADGNRKEGSVRSSETKKKRGGHRPRSAKGTPPRKPFKQGEDIRLNKYIARSGVCSRRDADTLIAEGKVAVNGKTVTEMGTKVRLKDTVEVNGRRIVPEHLVYVLLNKPADTITTTSDERDRDTVLDLIDESKLETDGLFPVGRLDRHTTGVLLLTNDGDLAHRLMHPSYEVDKVYVVEADRAVSEDDLERLRRGVELDDGRASADQAGYPDASNPKAIALSIHEGRNRQVRRMMEALGYTVAKLERIRYAGLTTQGVRRGKWRRLEKDEVAALYRQVKL